MLAGVSKSGSPISRWITCRPVFSRARARAAASKAVSVPRRDIRSAKRMPAMLANRTRTNPQRAAADGFRVWGPRARLESARDDLLLDRGRERAHPRGARDPAATA